MNPQARAAADRLAAFLDALTVRRSTTGGSGGHLIAAEQIPGDPQRELVAGDMRLVLATLDEQPDQRPVMHAISGLCTWKTCGHAERAEIYRMIGTCANCQGGPYLMLFTVGHERHALNCPACGTQNVRGTRLATADEIGAPAPENESEG